MGRSTTYYELRDALALAGCPVCRLRAKASKRYLDGLMWECVNDPGVRGSIRRARGFCHTHAMQLADIGDSLGTAIIVRDVLSTLIDTLEGATFQTVPLFSLRRAHEAVDPAQPAAATADLVDKLMPQAPCPACAYLQSMEAIYLSAFAESLLGADGLLDAYKSSSGLCLPHLRGTLAYVRDIEVFRALLDAQRDIWHMLVAELSDLMRKNDYRYRDEPWGEESNSWLRGLAAISGDFN